MEPGFVDLDVTDVSLVTADRLSFEEGLERVLAGACVLEAVPLPLADALGGVLAEPLISRAALPGLANSAMDGYALQRESILGATAELPARLRVIGILPAGVGWSGDPIAPGEAVAIMTGAPVPEGADSVVRIEHTRDAAKGFRGVGDVVEVTTATDAGRNIRPAGEDALPGDTMVAGGTIVRPGTVAVAAALGYQSLNVVRRPTFAILVSGDELVPPHRYREVIEAGGVPESNGPMLAAQVRASGAEVGRCNTVGDDPEELARAITRARSEDVLVISGGASMGAGDLVKQVLGELGFELEFWRLRMRPGSPVAFGRLDGLPVFSLPGNPASAFVSFELLVRPFLRAMAGWSVPVAPRLTALAGNEFASPPSVTSFARVTLEAGTPPVAVPSGPQGSGLVRSLGTADGLVVVPQGVARIERGEFVEVVEVGGCWG